MVIGTTTGGAGQEADGVNV
jgi:hypothetical protein